MIELDSIPKTYDDAVENLAAWHRDDASGLQIFAMPDPNGRVVMLLEVGGDVRDSDSPRPIAMGAGADFPFESVVLLMSEGDYERVTQGALDLPVGWDRDKLKKIG